MEKILNKFNSRTSDIVDLLKLELEQRQQRNPRYSLRSFATMLQMSPSFVSKVLNRKRSVTRASFNKFASQLNLTPDEIRNYQMKMAFSSIKDLEVSQEESNSGKSEYKLIELDQFYFISKWYHYAILELVSLPDFKASPTYIAGKLNITPFQAKEAWARLLRLGYVRCQKTVNGKKVFVTDNYTSINNSVVSIAKRNQQKEFLNLAMSAIDEVPFEERSQTSMTMAIPKQRIKEAQGLIQEFRRNLTVLMQRPGERDAVYQLSISFFPLTKSDFK